MEAREGREEREEIEATMRHDTQRSYFRSPAHPHPHPRRVQRTMAMSVWSTSPSPRSSRVGVPPHCLARQPHCTHTHSVHADWERVVQLRSAQYPAQLHSGTYLNFMCLTGVCLYGKAQHIAFHPPWTAIHRTTLFLSSISSHSSLCVFSFHGKKH